MAQVIARTLLATALALAINADAQDVPEAGIAAETRMDWSEAARIYRQALAERPEDAPLWQRLSQVEAKAGNAQAAAEALGYAAALQPGDAAAQAEYSSALAVAGRPAEALAAIQRALALDPDNVDYLVAQSQLANWNGDATLAQSSLERAVALAPGRADLRDDIARAQGWQGRLGAAVASLDEYLRDYPDDRAARLDRVRFLSWRGDYARAIDELDTVEAQSGSDAVSQALRARILAWAGRRQRALAINTPLLEAAPRDYSLHYTQALAERQGRIPARARPHVEAVQAQQPDSKETRDLARSTRVILASKVRGWFDFTEDSDDIRSLHSGVDGQIVLDDRLWLLLSAAERRVRAPIDGPFATDRGERNARDHSGLVGLRYALDQNHALSARAGVSVLEGGDSTGVFALEVDGLPNDTFGYLVGLERDRIDVSPKPLARGITRTGGHAELHAAPDLRNTFDLHASYDDYSDDNERLNFAATWRRAVVRHENVLVDLGVAGEWLHFSRTPNNGYYSPDSYRRFGAIGSAYWRLDDDSGLSLQIGLGMQRDETFDEWERASDVGLEYTTGIFSDWQLRVRAGYTERVQQTGAFEGSNASISIEHRF